MRMFIICGMATIAVLAATADGVKTQGQNPAVIDGMDIICGERALIVDQGKCRMADKSVEVKRTELPIDPAEMATVEDEWHPITDQRPQTWHSGTRLLAGRHPGRPNPVNLGPNAVVVYDQEKRTGTCYERDKDYFLDIEWGALCRLPTGKIKPNQRVAISYTYPMRRIDRIEVTPAGEVLLRRGTARPDLPLVPPATAGCLTLATVYRACYAKDVRPEHVFVLNPEKAAEVPTPDTHPVAVTLEKLRSGQPVTIVCWGDSVTDAGDVNPPEARYVNLFGTRLRERFGKADIKVINAGIGGTSTEGRLPAYEKEVLAHKPNLITVEFVNDMGLPPDKLQANWKNAIAQTRNIGAEFVVITPHFVMPSWMNKPFSRGPENRPNCLALRKLAAEQKVGLADAARRWELLEYQGIPYETLLLNGINHPDPRGHALFVDELMRLFPK
jgi:lysophospholipase L1-like esterase